MEIMLLQKEGALIISECHPEKGVWLTETMVPILNVYLAKAAVLLHISIEKHPKSICSSVKF